MNYFTGDLAPTATYKKRSWLYVPHASGEVVFAKLGTDGKALRDDAGKVVTETIPGKGLLTIKVQHARGYGCKCEVDSYVLDQVEPEHPGTRCFWLLNVSDPTQEQPYVVTLGGIERCRCTAGICLVPTGCKHTHAVQAMLDLGIFDDLETPAGSNERCGQWIEPSAPIAEEVPVWMQPVPF